MTDPTAVVAAVHEIARTSTLLQSRWRNIGIVVIVVTLVVATGVLAVVIGQVDERLQSVRSLDVLIAEKQHLIVDKTTTITQLEARVEELQGRQAQLERDASLAAVYAPSDVANRFASTVPTSATRDRINSLVEAFATDQRLAASNSLVALYAEDSSGVVTAGTHPTSEASSYRVNLYIAFTLARIKGGWQASDSQPSRSGTRK